LDDPVVGDLLAGVDQLAARVLEHLVRILIRSHRVSGRLRERNGLLRHRLRGVLRLAGRGRAGRARFPTQLADSPLELLGARLRRLELALEPRLVVRASGHHELSGERRFDLALLRVGLAEVLDQLSVTCLCASHRSSRSGHFLRLLRTRGQQRLSAHDAIR